MKFEWEKIHSQESSATYRAKVIGGWIISSVMRNYGEIQLSVSESMVFVPDPKHEWRIEE